MICGFRLPEMFIYFIWFMHSIYLSCVLPLPETYIEYIHFTWDVHSLSLRHALLLPEMFIPFPWDMHYYYYLMCHKLNFIVQFSPGIIKSILTFKTFWFGYTQVGMNMYDFYDWLNICCFIVWQSRAVSHMQQPTHFMKCCFVCVSKTEVSVY